MSDFNLFKIKNKIPRFFLLAESDNELLIDSDNELLVDLFIYSAKNISNITLKEFLFEKDSRIRNQNQLPIANQFIASILCKEAKYNGDILPKSNAKVKREFVFGSEWVYYKIYCGAKSADKLLQFALTPLLKEAYKRKLIDSWFFIRYNDPENHIRIRFHLIDECNLAEFVFLFNSLTILYCVCRLFTFRITVAARLAVKNCL